MSSEKPIQSQPDASNEAWETTAQWAKAEASTLEISDEVDRNARREAEAAKQAADAAIVRPSPLILRFHTSALCAFGSLVFCYRLGVPMVMRLLGWTAFLPRYNR